jgi:hypothetical protein
VSALDRWLAPYAATAATTREKSRQTASFAVATALRHAATDAGPISTVSQAVANGLRQEKPQSAAPFEAVSQMSQVSQAASMQPGGTARTCVTFDPLGDAGWTTEEWHAYFDERACFAEHDGGLRRAEAHARAFECCVSKWLIHNPPPASGPERCAQCRAPAGVNRAVPFLVGAGEHIWLHHACFQPWMTKLRLRAIEALASIGIKQPGM